MENDKRRRAQSRSVYLTEREAALIDAAAKTKELRVSEYMRSVLIADADWQHQRREQQARRRSARRRDG